MGDEGGRPRRWLLNSGGSLPSHDNRLCSVLLDGLRPQTIVLADRGYDAAGIREFVSDQGAWANIPPKKNRKNPIGFSPDLYRSRNRVERFFNKLKQCRRIRRQRSANSSTTGSDKRFARRGATGRFKDSDDAGRSLSADRRRKTRREPSRGRAIAAIVREQPLASSIRLHICGPSKADRPGDRSALRQRKNQLPTAAAFHRFRTGSGTDRTGLDG